MAPLDSPRRSRRVPRGGVYQDTRTQTAARVRVPGVGRQEANKLRQAPGAGAEGAQVHTLASVVVVVVADSGPRCAVNVIMSPRARVRARVRVRGRPSRLAVKT